MKFTVHLKDPDGFSDGVWRAARDSVTPIEGLDFEEQEGLADDRRDEIVIAIKKWVRYSEYISVEFDTELGTATVLPAGR